MVVCCNYRVSSRSRPLEFEIEMEIHMTCETSGVDLDRVWTGARQYEHKYKMLLRVLLVFAKRPSVKYESQTSYINVHVQT